MRVWVTGAGGLVGQAVSQALSKARISCVGSTRQQANVTDLGSLSQFCAQYGPFTHIVNCAAYTQVDQAETDPTQAHRLNTLSPALLGLLAADRGYKMVHLSTDYVFDGKGTSPYIETAELAPQSIYGKTKAEGEQRLLALVPHACIIRTSWVFSSQDPQKKSFVSKIIDKMMTHQELSIVSDQYGRPTSAHTLAATLLDLLNFSGIYHVANQGATSRYDLAQVIREEALKCGLPLVCKRLTPVPSQAFSSPAFRPPYSVLSTDKVEIALGKKLPHWKESLTTTLLQWAGHVST